MFVIIKFPAAFKMKGYCLAWAIQLGIDIGQTVMLNSRNVNPLITNYLHLADHIDEEKYEFQNQSQSAFETNLIQSSENIFLQLVYNILDNSPRGPGGDNLIDSSGKRKYFVSFFFSDKYK